MPSHFHLLPNLALGAMVGTTTGPDGRATSAFEITIEGDTDGSVSAQGLAIAKSARFRGIGDVVGIAPGEIARSEPAPGRFDFSPDLMPFVEFRAPDLPWRFSPERGRRARPWLVAVALRDDEFTALGQGSAPLRRILVGNPGASLPALADSWAFAHVQVNADVDRAGALAMLEADPQAGFARMLCPRRMDALTHYTLALVPAYEAGRLAGLGRGEDEVAMAGLADAWDDSDTPVELPIYWQARFRTEAGADLESALRRLKGLTLEDAAALAVGPGFRLVDIGPIELPDEGTGEVRTALRAAGIVPPGNPASHRLQRRMARVLNAAIDEIRDREDPDGDDKEEDDNPEGGDGNDPLVTFPARGLHHAGDAKVRPTGPDWFSQLNLDPRFRLAARLGADLVSGEQERLVARAWEQHREIEAANRDLKRLQVAETLVSRITRRFDKLAPDLATVLAEPMQPFARRRQDDSTVADRLDAAGAPPSFASRDLRRLSARVAGRGADGAATVPLPPIPGDRTPSQGSKPLDGSRIEAMERDIADRNFNLQMETVIRPGNLWRAGPTPRTDMRAPAVPVGRFRSRALHTALTGSLRALPRLKVDHLVTGRSAAETDRGGPVARVPRLPVHLADLMVKANPRALLPDIDSMPDDRIAFFEEDRGFVEALMAGANHAMNDELRWRGFPVDLRGTTMPRFWNRGAAWDDTEADDIGGIAGWRKPLGRNPSPARSGGETLVVVIKGAVVRMLDAPILAIDIAEDSRWTPEGAERHLPAFTGTIGRDIAYFGFDFGLPFVQDRLDRAHFVIMEPAGRIVFGLDRPGSGPFDRWDDIDWDDVALGDGGYVSAAQGGLRPAATAPDYWGDDRSAATIAAVLPMRTLFDA